MDPTQTLHANLEEMIKDWDKHLLELREWAVKSEDGDLVAVEREIEEIETRKQYILGLLEKIKNEEDENRWQEIQQGLTSAAKDLQSLLDKAYAKIG